MGRDDAVNVARPEAHPQVVAGLGWMTGFGWAGNGEYSRITVRPILFAVPVDVGVYNPCQYYAVLRRSLAFR